LTVGGKTQAGIYRLAANQNTQEINVLSLCLNEKADKRPTDFSDDKGSGNVLFLLQRQSHSADTKWTEKLFRDGLVLDFGMILTDHPKTVKPRIRNPYPLPVYVQMIWFNGDKRWLTWKLPDSQRLEPSEEMRLEVTLHPDRIWPDSFGPPTG